MASRRNLARVGAAVAAAAVFGAIAAIPASAEAAKGTLHEEAAEQGLFVHLTHGGKKFDLRANLLKFELSDGKFLQVYCVGAEIAWSHETNIMKEVPWDSYPGADDSLFKQYAGKINWVLHNGYPVNDEAYFNAKNLPNRAAGETIERAEVIAATQAAIWHFSDGLDLDEENSSGGVPGETAKTDDDKDVYAVYKYLIDNAKDIGEPEKGELKVAPSKRSGKPGDKIGPFKVSSNGTIKGLDVNLPEGVKVVDKDGKAITTVKDGTEIYLQIPADAKDGKGSFSVTGEGPAIEVGRLFVGKNREGEEAQPLIVAGTETVPLKAVGEADWAKGTTPTTTTTAPTTTAPTTTVPPTTTTVAPAPQPSNNLPDTGANILVPVLVGVGLLGAGAGALLYVRHRRNAA
ncbi:thioester domain-containing protein [Actinokineospora auranticolor]|uniref:LPXTG-motif cell wall-anchored protein/TQXA domain-containing protein n=1 Tax=Actinokineospora auranticolor TaxID=155976 RepID=A0A2S6GL69_9PSEU|nr:thioester domain-containing protein [Actinokineospora auranticolor]PPK65896.1 LPXTG-motif cell wall-anchored protein/TQXA domain-containing protein [Actinokineospora auranticolor]